MLKIEAKGVEVTNFNPRKEAHGDEFVPGVDMTVVFDTADTTVAEFIASAPNVFWNDDGDPLMQSVYPLLVKEKHVNYAVELRIGRSKVKFPEADLAKIEITPKQDRRAEVKLHIQTRGEYLTNDEKIPAHLWRSVREQIGVLIEARQHDAFPEGGNADD